MAPDSASPYDDHLRVAAWLRQAADLPQAQGANVFPIGAYRRAAESVERSPRSVRELLRRLALYGVVLDTALYSNAARAHELDRTQD